MPMGDIRAILRAADPLVAVGGRSLLTKILRGSRSQDVLSHGLDQNPSYGLYKELSEEQVLGRVDWMIANGYLRIVYDGRLPLLAYTSLGWEIECETYADEIIASFDALLESRQAPLDISYLRDRNRELVMLVLSKLRDCGNPKYLPILDAWEAIAYKKVKQEIRQLKAQLSQAVSGSS